MAVDKRVGPRCFRLSRPAAGLGDGPMPLLRLFARCTPIAGSSSRRTRPSTSSPICGCSRSGRTCAPHDTSARFRQDCATCDGKQPTSRALQTTSWRTSTASVPDGTFDAVVAGQVIEHVRTVWLWMREVARVVRPGGLVVIIAPVSWPFHEAPVDCWRIYPEAMRTLADEASLDVVDCRFESLEPPRTRRSYPGGNRDNLDPDRSMKARLRKLVGWPQPAALDTILVARRPSRTATSELSRPRDVHEPE